MDLLRTLTRTHDNSGQIVQIEKSTSDKGEISTKSDDTYHFEIINDYRPEGERADLREIIQLLRETKARLELENKELKEKLEQKSQALNESRQRHAALQEQIVHLTTENNLLREHKNQSHSEAITEEKLKSMLNESSEDLFGKLDENFKRHLAFIRERNMHIREGNPFPFTPERTGLLTPFVNYPWMLLNSQRKTQTDAGSSAGSSAGSVMGKGGDSFGQNSNSL